MSITLDSETLDEMEERYNVVRIDHDDQPNEVADKFIEFLTLSGHEVNTFRDESGSPSLWYEIISP
jgi:hypothetical protein